MITSTVPKKSVEMARLAERCAPENRSRGKTWGWRIHNKKTIIEIDGVFQTMSESKPETWVSPERLPSRSFGAVEEQRDVVMGKKSGVSTWTRGGDS